MLQTSAPFTVVLGALLLRERLHARQSIGLAVASGGIAMIGADRMGEAALLPMLLTLAGGLAWAMGNIGSRLATNSAPSVNPLHLTLWMTVIPPVPMFALSAVIEGPATGLHALTDLTAPTAPAALLGLTYLVTLGTVAGSGLWTYLLSRYPVGTVAPLSLLVPVVGIGASWLVLHEIPSAAQLLGAVVVMAGAFVTVSSGGRATRPDIEPDDTDGSDRGIGESTRVQTAPGRVADNARGGDESPVIGLCERGRVG